MKEVSKINFFDIQEKSNDFEKSLDNVIRRNNGIYYTNIKLTNIMVKELIAKIIADNKNIYSLTLLEPCVGTGNFILSYLNEISLMNPTKDEVLLLLDNIHVCDINQSSINYYKKVFTTTVKKLFGIDVDSNYFKTNVKNALLFDINKDVIEYIPFQKLFSSDKVKNGFDIIITNPPYKVFKAEKQNYKTDKEYLSSKTKYKEISTVCRNFLTLSLEGVLNYYKLFVEEILLKYSHSNSYISLLIPSSLLTDKTCSKLRTYILENNTIFSIKNINENEAYVNANQSMITIFIQKEKRDSIFSIYNNVLDENCIKMNVFDILNVIPGNSIYCLNSDEYEKFKLLNSFPKIKDLSFISNLRGELDLTLNKNNINQLKISDYKLLRGRNIGLYELSCESNEYVDNKFLQNTKKDKYIYNPRIACQQVVNMNKKKRVSFSYIEKNYVLGNSCNFISVKDNEYNIDLYILLGIFNSSIINWYFKLISSNNHINNYEIDCFPIPIYSKKLTAIRKLVLKYLDNNDQSILSEIDLLVNQAYGIDNIKFPSLEKSKNEYLNKFWDDLKFLIPSITIDTVSDLLFDRTNIDEYLISSNIILNKFDKNVLEGITKKYQKLNNNEILNHTSFKLSDLDIEMITNVPQGGNWKNIPKKTILKSKRLTKISESGGRTTLYGRIDYNKPSYTITTYFNRPGNGTYVHPIHNRVLSVREAARFQGFMDDYYFYGNKTQLLKQVGNAVPSILAYQIAQNIVDKVKCTKSIDLFCGAGGMTAGFKEAGITSIISNDFEESACITLKINNPEIEVVCADITKEETKKHIVDKAIQNKVDIICGGPPCQGFSMAGHRLTDDPRNQLFKDFIEVVDKVKPKVVVFENVEGILSYQNGEVYKTILNTFSEIGYNCNGKTLMSNEYAVPQKRKRVIIICVRKDISIEPEQIFPLPITLNINDQVTAMDTINDLENICCEENAKYENLHDSNFVKLCKRKISYLDYIGLHSKDNSKDNVVIKKELKYEQLSLIM